MYVCTHTQIYTHAQGNLLAASSQTGSVNVFSINSPASDKPEAVFSHHNKFLLSVAYSPDGKMVATGAIDGAVHVIDSVSGNLIRKLEGHSKPVRSLSFAPGEFTMCVCVCVCVCVMCAYIHR